MAPLHGWAPVGQRLHAKRHWRTMPFLVALRCDRIDAPCVLDQPANGQSFTDYVEPFLVPTLSPQTNVAITRPPPDTGFDESGRRLPCKGDFFNNLGRLQTVRFQLEISESRRRLTL